jgi:hypothetical protein
MADLFISYASEDHARVAPMVGNLEEAGWTVWWDRDLIGGPDFTDSIQNALDTASCVVVVWSRHSVESNWVRDEAQEGMQRHSLVPCSIDDVRPPLGFRSLQTISMIGWPEQQNGLPRLLEAVRASLAVTALDVNLVSGARGKRYQQHRNSDARELLYRGMFEFRKFEQSTLMTATR